MTSSSLFTADAGTPDVHRRTRSNEENVRDQELTMDDLSLADMSTPKAASRKKDAKLVETPYQKIQHQIQEQYRIDSSNVSISRQNALDRYSTDNGNSHSVPEIDSPASFRSANSTPSTPSSIPRLPQSTVKRRSPTKREDPLLHRVLDNNWRLQATPLTKRNLYAERDALSSPPPPELTSQIFSPSPMAKMLKTPLDRRDTTFDDSDDDSDGELGMSPPVTMQFSMPASKLIKTPARTAAMNIVEEMLRTAGARDKSLDSIGTPVRLSGRKIDSNASEQDMWNAIRGSGSDKARKKVDVDLDGSPYIQKTHDLGNMIGGIGDRTTLTLITEEHTAPSLNDWQSSEDWLH
jgi:hypothetical protein